MFYPMIEQGRFEGLSKLAEMTRVSLGELQRALDNAAIERSELAICEGTALGEPSCNVRAVLQTHIDGSITLWAGLFAEARNDREEVQMWLADAQDVFGDRTVAIGEFTPRRVGNA